MADAANAMAGIPVQNGLLTVTLEDQPVGVVAENGDVYQRRGDLNTPEARELYFRVQDISREVSEYRKEMERAPVLEAEGLNEPYKLLAEIYRSVQQTLYTDLKLTWAQEKTLQSVSDQITELLPGIAERQIQQQGMEQSM